MVQGADRRTRGPLLSRNPHPTQSFLTPDRLPLTRRTRAKVNQKRRRGVDAVATVRASPVDQRVRVAIILGLMRSPSTISLVAFLQWVQMRPSRPLPGTVSGVNGTSGVERPCSLRLWPLRHRGLGQAIHSILQRTRRLRTRLIQGILVPRRAFNVARSMQDWSFSMHFVFGIDYKTGFSTTSTSFMINDGRI
ncbi:hypothetical protein BDR22DRAFT_869266 [Usnea florida]